VHYVPVGLSEEEHRLEGTYIGIVMFALALQGGISAALVWWFYREDLELIYGREENGRRITEELPLEG
jgi:hypothetical protein